MEKESFAKLSHLHLLSVQIERKAREIEALKESSDAINGIKLQMKTTRMQGPNTSALFSVADMFLQYPKDRYSEFEDSVHSEHAYIQERIAREYQQLQNYMARQRQLQEH